MINARIGCTFLVFLYYVSNLVIEVLLVLHFIKSSDILNMSVFSMSTIRQTETVEYSSIINQQLASVGHPLIWTPPHLLLTGGQKKWKPPADCVEDLEFSFWNSYRVDNNDDNCIYIITIRFLLFLALGQRKVFICSFW